MTAPKKPPTLAQLIALAERKGMTWPIEHHTREFGPGSGNAFSALSHDCGNNLIDISHEQRGVMRSAMYAALSVLPDKKASKR